MRRLGVLSLVCVAGTGMAPRQATAQDAIVLRMDPPAGQVVHYRTDMQMFMPIGMPGMPAPDSTTPTMVQTMYTTKTVTSVEGDVRVITTVVDSNTMDMPGIAAQMGGVMPQNVLQGMTTVQRWDSRGRLLSSEVTQAPPMMQQLMGGGRMGGRGGMMGGMGGGGAGARGQSYFLPESPVRVGDTWTLTDSTQVPGGPGSGQMSAPVQITYRLERIDQQGGSRVAVISMNGTLGGPGRGTMSGEFAVDLDAKRMIRMNTEIVAQSQTQRGPLPVRTRLTTTAL